MLRCTCCCLLVFSMLDVKSMSSTSSNGSHLGTESISRPTSVSIVFQYDIALWECWIQIGFALNIITHQQLAQTCHAPPVVLEQNNKTENSYYIIIIILLLLQEEENVQESRQESWLLRCILYQYFSITVLYQPRDKISIYTVNSTVFI